MKLLFINFAKSFNSATNKTAFLNAKMAFISNNYKSFIEYFQKNCNEFVLDEIKNHIFYNAFKEYLLGKIDYNYYRFYLRGKKVSETKDFLFHVRSIKMDDTTLKDFTAHMDYFKQIFFNIKLFEKENELTILRFKNENILLDGEHRAVLSELLPDLKLKYKVYE